MDLGYNLEFCAPSTGLTKCDRRPRRIGRRDPSTGGEDELAMAVSGPAHKYTRMPDGDGIVQIQFAFRPAGCIGLRQGGADGGQDLAEAVAGPRDAPVVA